MKEHFMFPVISVIVITYNSAKTIIETLMSIRKQDYPNIEVIISDDYSIDNTIILCEEWKKDNLNFFDNILIIRATENKGIPANCNQGLKYSTGKYIKLIAGDDLLAKKNSLSTIANYFNSNPSHLIVQTQILTFGNKSSRENILPDLSCDNFFTKEPFQQYKFLFRRNCIRTPGIYFQKELFETVGNFDERYPTMEDFPFWLKITKKGYKIHYFKEISVKYRIHDESISNITEKSKEKEIKWSQNLLKIAKDSLNNKIIIEYILFVIKFKSLILLNNLNITKKNKFGKIIHTIVWRITSL